jgi:dienelactone hydrolase
MKRTILLTGLIVLAAGWARAQSAGEVARAALAEPVESQQVVTFQLQEYLTAHAAKLPTPSSAEEWTAEAERIRTHVLKDVVFHGWPDAWINSSPRFEDWGEIPTSPSAGFLRRKLRYEIVPGFYSTAILYEPRNLKGKAPAVLDLMGHFSAGKAMEFEQTLCINQALRGMVALNLEWLDMGELRDPQNDHSFAAHLDLVGSNGVGLFYLAMRRGLDYLAQNPDVDATRIGVTGLSGGGWQTIILSALDTRVAAAVPVAGYTSLAGRAEVLPGEPGDNEQNATDLVDGQDYPTFTALRAPRPTLLINAAEDNCCFRAPMVRPYIFDAVRPFFRLFGRDNAFGFYQNTLISAHNFGPESRERSYRFFTDVFRLPAIEKEIPVGEEIKSYSELAVGVPRNNVTVLGLARQFAAAVARPAVPSESAARDAWINAARETLRKVVRYEPVSVKETWLAANANHSEVESASYRFEMDNGLPATAVWIRETQTPESAALTVVLNDNGKKAARAEMWDQIPEVGDRLERGEQVLAADLVFTGDASPGQPPSLFTQMLAASGARPLGLEAAQLIALARWARRQFKPARIRVETTGLRSQTQALVAAALEPELFSEVAAQRGMRSLNYLLDKPVDYEIAPDVFCLDLYKDFDIDRLEVLAAPATVTLRDPLEAGAKSE